MPRLLNRTEILGADDLATRDVPVPEWQPNGVVRVRALTAAEWITVGRLTMKDADGKSDEAGMLELMIRIPAMCIVDEQGANLFSEADIEALGKKNATPLKRIMEAVQELSDLDRDAAKKA